ncbi:amidase [Bauldia sp.]|uniref:amidase n=1 Tax=Bauldia sp. TaxID=2575872 RepID=UPI003BAD6EA5
MPNELADLDAIEALDDMAHGLVSAGEVCDSCLKRIAERESDVGAFAHLDPDHARRQAEVRDKRRAAGCAVEALDGIPVALKDIVDTKDMPTENGTPLDAGRWPTEDAVIVKRLRQAGAVLMGKTVTTELGSKHPRGTRNPHNREHTPGGSSSGSAAAVAAGMVPLAIGTQTNGSVIRPASFCGIVGFKPSFGLIPRGGVLPQARPLDTIGAFSRSIADAALIIDVLAGHDPSDQDSLHSAPVRLLDVLRTEPPGTPKLAFVKGPAWHLAAPHTKAGFAELAEALGNDCEEVVLPDEFSDAEEMILTLMLAGLAKNYGDYRRRGANQLSDFMREAIKRGEQIAAIDYLHALDVRDQLMATLNLIFERYDAILTPAAVGEAPHGLDTTGDPAFCSLWSFCGVPAVSLPLLEGPNRLPVGVQLVGRRGDDAKLLQAALWLQLTLGDDLKPNKAA